MFILPVDSWLGKRWRISWLRKRIRDRETSYETLGCAGGNRGLLMSPDRLLDRTLVNLSFWFENLRNLMISKVRVPSMRPLLQPVRQPPTPLALRLRWSTAPVCLHALRPPISTPFQSASSRRPQQLPAPHSRQHLKDRDYPFEKNNRPIQRFFSSPDNHLIFPSLFLFKMNQFHSSSS